MAGPLFCVSILGSEFILKGRKTNSTLFHGKNQTGLCGIMTIQCSCVHFTAPHCETDPKTSISITGTFSRKNNSLIYTSTFQIMKHLMAGAALQSFYGQSPQGETSSISPTYLIRSLCDFFCLFFV